MTIYFSDFLFFYFSAPATTSIPTSTAAPTTSTFGPAASTSSTAGKNDSDWNIEMENLRVEFICYLFNIIFINLLTHFYDRSPPNNFVSNSLFTVFSFTIFFVHVDNTTPAATPPIVPIIKAPAEFRLD